MGEQLGRAFKYIDETKLWQSIKSSSTFANGLDHKLYANIAWVTGCCDYVEPLEYQCFSV